MSSGLGVQETTEERAQRLLRALGDQAETTEQRAQRLLLDLVGPQQESEDRVGVGEGLLRALQALGSVFTGGGDPAGQIARQNLLLTNVIQTGAIEPVAAVTEIPGRIANELGAEEFAARSFEVAEAIRGFGDKGRDRALLEARELGLPQEEVIGNSVLGGLVGFIAPLSLSLKTAGLVFKGGSIPGLLVRDATAGVIMGSVLRPGLPEERLKHGIVEGGLFAALNIVGLGILAPIVSMRNRRLIRLAGEEAGRAQLIYEWDASVGGMRTSRLNASQGRAVALVRSEENLVMQSEPALELVRRGMDEAALVQGVKSFSRSEQSHGVVRGVGQPSEVLPQLAEQHPGLKFAFVKRAEGVYDVVFGARPLNPVQLKSFKEQGFFEGQVVNVAGKHAQYLKHTKKGKITIKDLASGKQRTVQEKLVQPTSFGTTGVEVQPTLVKDFIQWWENKVSGIAKARGGTHQDELVRQAREGRLPDDLFEPWAPVEAEAVTGLEDVIAISRRRTDQAISEVQAGMDPRFPEVAQSTVEGLEKVHQQFVERIAKAQQESRASLTEELSRSGLEDVYILEQRETHTFADFVKQWAKERGIIIDESVGRAGIKELGPVDIEEFTTFAAQELRRHLLSTVPKSERSVLEGIEAEYLRLFEEANLADDVFAMGPLKGYQAIREADGTITLRDITNRISDNFKNERAALEALRNTERPGINPDFPSVVPGEMVSGPPIEIGGEIPDGAIMDAFPEFVPSVAFGSANVKLPTNLMDRFKKVEDRTGLPLFQLFDRLNQGLQRLHRLEAVDTPLSVGAFQGLKIRDRLRISDWWRTVEGQGLSTGEKIRIGREMGLSGKHFNAARRARRVWNRAFIETGMRGDEFIEEYFGRIRPYIERTGVPLNRETMGRIYPDGIPLTVKEWYTFTRTSEMSHIERDPLAVMMKYFRTLRFKQEVGPAWEELRSLVRKKGGPLNLESMNRQARQNVIDALGGENSVKMLNEIMRNWSTRLRGYPTQDLRSMRGYTKRMFKSLGIDADERVAEEMINAYMATLYGSYIGLAPQMFARNLTQNMFTLYSRLGSKHAGASLRRAMTLDGYNEAVTNLAVRTREGGVFAGDVAFEGFLEAMPFRGENLFSQSLASVGNLGIRMGNISRKTAAKFMVPFSSTDDINRVWAYHWQKMHMTEWLEKFNTGKIGWDKFLEEGLPFFSPSVKDQFTRLLKLGEDKAIAWVSRQASDEAHWIYGITAQPLFLQKTFGRLAGTFGVWPLWAKELYMNRWRLGTPKQRAMFWARTSAVSGAVGLVAASTGINMWRWIAPTSFLQWYGGPVLDFGIDFHRALSGPPEQFASGMIRLGEDIALSAIPGQRAFGDFTKPFEFTDDPREAMLMMMLGRPDRASLDLMDFSMEFPPAENPGFLDTKSLSLDSLRVMLDAERDFQQQRRR